MSDDQRLQGWFAQEMGKKTGAVLSSMDSTLAGLLEKALDPRPE